MKINRYLFKNKDYVASDDIVFSSEHLDPSHIKEISSCHVEVTGQDYDELLVLHFKIDAEVIGVCSYSLEDVPLTVKIDTTLNFSFDEEDEDIIHIDNPIFDIDEVVYSLIVSEVPLKIVKKGAKLPNSGNGYRVMSEEEYKKENEKKTDSRWSKLDNIELD